MSSTIFADPVPLRLDDSGTVRVGDTRITLDLIVEEYQKHKSPEEIVRDYDVLDLADVYAAIAYYLRHQTELDDYLRRREAEAARLRQVIEANQPPGPSKEELLRRRAQMQRDQMTQLLAEMQANSVFLPPGCPTTTELLREDRDR